MCKPTPTPDQDYLQGRYDYDPSDKTFPLVFREGGFGRRKGQRPGSMGIQAHRSNYRWTSFRISDKDYFGNSYQHSWSVSRIVWKYHYGVEPKGVIDHINGDSTDNRIENLQDITQGENLRKAPGEVVNSILHS